MLNESLKYLKLAVDGLMTEPESLDHWHQANYCLRSLAAVLFIVNPNHFGAKENLQEKPESDT